MPSMSLSKVPSAYAWFAFSVFMWAVSSILMATHLSRGPRPTP